MRMLVTADLHYNHGRSTALADDAIERMNALAGEVDALLVVGDTAAFDGDALERCLTRFHFDRVPRLFVAGNHELWTRGPDSYALFKEDLPRRVRALSWHWLQDEPWAFASEDVAIVGSVGWYDYAFAVDELGIPRRFYERGVSPGAAMRVAGYETLDPEATDVPAHARDIVARWNDMQFVKLGRSDAAFLDELLAQLDEQLASLRSMKNIIAAVHHVPLPQLLPPRHGGLWDFARAYLGSPKIGELLLRYPNVSHVLCGHSHFAVEARINNVLALNIGSGYRQKLFRIIEV